MVATRVEGYNRVRGKPSARFPLRGIPSSQGFASLTVGWAGGENLYASGCEPNLIRLRESQGIRSIGGVKNLSSFSQENNQIKALSTR